MYDKPGTDSQGQAPNRGDEVIKLSIPATILTLCYDNRREFKRFAKFSIVGAIGAVIDFAVLTLMHTGFGWPPLNLIPSWNILNQILNLIHTGFDWPLLSANTLSVSTAIVSNFTWNRLWTFRESRSRRKREQLPRFALINFVGLAINNLIVVGLAAVFTHFITGPWDVYLAKAIAIGVVLFWNFGANRLWTYRGL